MNTYTVNDTTLRDYLRILFKYKYLIIITIIPVVIINYIRLEFVTPIYSSSANLLITGARQTEVTYYKGIYAGVERQMRNHSALLKSKEVLKPVVMALKLYEISDDYERKFARPLKRQWIDYVLNKKGKGQQKDNFYELNERAQARRIDNAVGRLRGKVGVASIERSDVFVISANDYDPVTAALIANSVSRSYVMYDIKQQLAEFKLKYGEKHTTVKQLQGYIEELQKTLHGQPLSNADILWPGSIKAVDQAEVPRAPTSETRRVLTLTTTVGGGFLFGIVLSLVLGFFDQRFRSPDDLKSFLKIPLIGSIPKIKKKDKLLIEDSKLPTNYEQAFYKISEQIYLYMKDEQSKAILVAGIRSSKETAVITINLYSYLSQKINGKILIIDADLRGSLLTQILKIPKTKGLGEVLEGKANFTDVIYEFSNKLNILQSGGSTLNPLNLVSSDTMTKMISEISAYYELILIVCPGLNDYHDAVVLSSVANGVILIVDEEKDRRQVVRFAINPIEQKKANIIGAILNNRKYIIPEIIYKLT